MAYLFQHGPAILSGAVDQEGSIDIKDDGSGEFELKHDGNTIISSTRALANVTTISGSEVISGRDLKLDATGKIGVSNDTDLMTLTAGNVVVDGAHSASARLDGAGLRIDTGGVIGTAGDNDLLTLNNNSLVVAGAAQASNGFSATGGNIAAVAGAVSGSTGLAGRGLTLDANGVIGTATDADLLLLGDNKLSVRGDLSASADVEGLKANFESYEVKDGLVIDDARNITAVQLSGSGNLLAAGTVRFDGVADTAMVIGDDLFFRDSDGLMKREAAADVRDLYFSAVSGDATVAAGGVLTIAAGAVENSMLADDAVGADELAANAVVEASIVDNAVTLAKMAGITRGSIILGDSSGDPSLLAKGTAAQFLQSDGTDPSYVSISGDATVAAGGALTIAAGAVEEGMLNDNVISGQAELAHADIADADEFLISDGGTLKRVGVDSLRDHYFGVVSGDATIADGGALTIAANAVEGSMINSNAAGDGLAYSSNALQLDLNELTAAAVAVAADSIAIIDADDNSSKKESIADLVSAMAGAGLTATNGVLSTQAGVVTSIRTDGAVNTTALVEGYNFYTGSLARSVSLPASPTVGDIVVVKAGNLGDGNGLTVARQGSHLIDGLQEVKLESDYAAASFVYLEANLWGII